jgi:hypothetical protein
MIVVLTVHRFRDRDGRSCAGGVVTVPQSTARPGRRRSRRTGRRRFPIGDGGLFRVVTSRPRRPVGRVGHGQLADRRGGRRQGVRREQGGSGPFESAGPAGRRHRRGDPSPRGHFPSASASWPRPSWPTGRPGRRRRGAPAKRRCRAGLVGVRHEKEGSGQFEFGGPAGRRHRRGDPSRVVTFRPASAGWPRRSLPTGRPRRGCRPGAGTLAPWRRCAGRW